MELLFYSREEDQKLYHLRGARQESCHLRHKSGGLFKVVPVSSLGFLRIKPNAFYWIPVSYFV